MKKIFSLFTAILFAGSMMAAEAVLQYTGGVTTNMVGDGANNAATLGLDEALFTVLADKGGNSNFPGLNKNNDIRLYADKNTGNGNIITVSIASGTINSIVLDIKQTATFVVKAGETAVTEAEGAYAINAASFSIQNTTTGETTQLQLNKITISYTPAAAPTVSKPAILGKAKFVGETEVTLSCETEGAKIYYTLDGEDPDAEATEYLGLAIKLTETTTVKAIAIKGADKSSIAEKAFTYYEAKTCAEAAALEANEVAGLNEVTVTYVNGGNTYVKDATGYELIYAFDFGLVAGDVVNGFIGKSSPFNGLPELKPEGVALADLDVVHGEAPAPEEIKAAPTSADINKYLIIKGVSVEGEFTTASATNLNATIGEETFVLRNNFKIAQTFEKDKKYDIVGTGAIYTKNDNTTLQLYFISATESSTTALDNNAVETKAVKAIVNGQLLITRDGKTFNVLGTVVK